MGHEGISIESEKDILLVFPHFTKTMVLLEAK